MDKLESLTLKTEHMSATSPENTKYVAIDLDDRSRIVARGETFESTMERAREVTEFFSIAFVPKPGQTYIY